MELPVNLLLVDDVGEDADMFAYALESLGRPVHLQHECSVESACDYLKGNDIDEIPDIIIVDSFLRGPSGDQLLACIECVPQLAFVPIVVLSGAQLPSSGTANPRIKVHYVKPVCIAELRAIVGEIVDTAGKYATDRMGQHA